MNATRPAHLTRTVVRAPSYRIFLFDAGDRYRNWYELGGTPLAVTSTPLAVTSGGRWHNSEVWLSQALSSHRQCPRAIGPLSQTSGRKEYTQWWSGCWCCMPYTPLAAAIYSQSNGWSRTVVASMCWRVFLNLSTRPSLCGWYGVVLDLLIPKTLQTSCTNSDSN